MARAIRVDATYPHPPELVWTALTDPKGVVGIWNGSSGSHSFELEVVDQGGLSAKTNCGSVVVP